MKVPILDLKVWIQEVEIENVKQRRILHEYYDKEVSSKLLIHRRAALSLNEKRTILTQQCLRILLNCSPELSQEIVEKHLSFFILRMQFSGYDQNLRYEILKSAYDAYDEIKRRDREEGKPMYREKSYKRNERRKEKIEKSKTWYGKGDYETVMFVPATPSSTLRKEMQTYITDTGIKIKVIEKSGIKIVRMLQKNDPFRNRKCEKDDCFVCKGENGGNCRSSGIIYEINCEGECPVEYYGQTSANGYTRGLKHQEDLIKRRERPLWKHCVNKHNSAKREFSMKVVATCRNDATKRQIMEAIFIQKTDRENSLNERSEWNNIRIPRIEINT